MDMLWIFQKIWCKTIHSYICFYLKSVESTKLLPDTMVESRMKLVKIDTINLPIYHKFSCDASQLHTEYPYIGALSKINKAQIFYFNFQFLQLKFLCLENMVWKQLANISLLNYAFLLEWSIIDGRHNMFLTALSLADSQQSLISDDENHQHLNINE